MLHLNVGIKSGLESLSTSLARRYSEKLQQLFAANDATSVWKGLRQITNCKPEGPYTPGRISRKTPRVKASFKKKNASGLFFWILPCRVKNYPTNEIGAFAHVSGAAEVTVKHNLGALKHKTVLPSTHT